MNVKVYFVEQWGISLNSSAYRSWYSIIRYLSLSDCQVKATSIFLSQEQKTFISFSILAGLYFAKFVHSSIKSLPILNTLFLTICRLKEKIALKIEFLHFGHIDFCSFEFTILIQDSFISIICQKILLLLIFYIHKFCNNPTCFCQVYVSGCTSKLTYMMNAFIPCISITFNFNNGIT